MTGRKWKNDNRTAWWRHLWGSTGRRKAKHSQTALVTASLRARLNENMKHKQNNETALVTASLSARQAENAWIQSRWQLHLALDIPKKTKKQSDSFSDGVTKRPTGRKLKKLPNLISHGLTKRWTARKQETNQTAWVTASLSARHAEGEIKSFQIALVTASRS